MFFDGERVGKVTEHPAFRNAARTVAHLYDMLHDDAHRDALTAVDRFGHVTHRFFAPAYSAADLIGARDAIAIWQRETYGWMGRTPDYKASFMAQLADGEELYAPYHANALAWYHRYASKALFLNHVLVDPPVDRANPRHTVRDVFITADHDDDRGIYVSGAKMVATGSALTHATFIAANSASAASMQAGRDEDMALVFIADVNTPGSKLICRPSYERNAVSPSTPRWPAASTRTTPSSSSTTPSSRGRTCWSTATSSGHGASTPARASSTATTCRRRPGWR